LSEALELEPVADDEDLEDVEAPTKVVVEVVQLEVAAKVLFIEGFSGCSDARSLCTIVGGVAPRHLVLVGATAQDTADMALACAKELPLQQTKMHTPGKECEGITWRRKTTDQTGSRL
jgi:predicted metal-dependent RNase